MYAPIWDSVTDGMLQAWNLKVVYLISFKVDEIWNTCCHISITVFTKGITSFDTTRQHQRIIYSKRQETIFWCVLAMVVICFVAFAYKQIIIPPNLNAILMNVEYSIRHLDACRSQKL